MILCRTNASSSQGETMGTISYQKVSHTDPASERLLATPYSERFSNSRFGLKPLCAAVPAGRFVRVAVIGLGDVGLPLAAAVAATGANVVGIDIDPEKVKAVNAGKSPLRGREPGVAELVGEQVSKGRLRASLEASAAANADV